MIAAARGELPLRRCIQREQPTGVLGWTPHAADNFLGALVEHGGTEPAEGSHLCPHEPVVEERGTGSCLCPVTARTDHRVNIRRRRRGQYHR